MYRGATDNMGNAVFLFLSVTAGIVVTETAAA
jgi:hypothetical protein